MKRKSLFVAYVRLKSSHPCDYVPVYCYAFSFCHATNLAIEYCVHILHWELNSFEIPEPILVENFIK